MGLRAAFFDVGNTLLFEEPSRFEIYARAARGRGLDVETAAMGQLMRDAHEELPREIDGAFRYTDSWFTHYVEAIFCGRLGLERASVPQLMEELFGQFADPRTFRLFPGTLSLLSRARELGLAVGLISNWSPRLPKLLADLDLERHVDFHLCSAIERLEKPEPEIFERALERAGVAPQEALHAGDHPVKDCEAAGRLGMRTVLVDHANQRPASARGADLRVTHLHDLELFLQCLAP